MDVDDALYQLRHDRHQQRGSGGVASDFRCHSDGDGDDEVDEPGFSPSEGGQLLSEPV